MPRCALVHRAPSATLGAAVLLTAIVGSAALGPAPSARAEGRSSLLDPIEPAGAAYRERLGRGRALAASDRCDEGVGWLEAAIETGEDDDGRAAAELVRCARILGDAALAEEHASTVLEGAPPGVRAAVLYELGRLAEAAGEHERALARFVESLALRPRREVALRARAADRRARDAGHPVRGASASVLSAVDAGPCNGPRPCRTLRRLARGGAIYAIVAESTADPTEVEIEGATYVLDEGEIAQWLYVGADGRWWRAELGSDGGAGIAGTGWGTEIDRFELVQAVAGGPPELLLRTRFAFVDYDWCESYWTRHDATSVCGLDGARAVCWAEVTTLDAEWVGPGRIALAPPDPDAEAPDDGSLEDECGRERALVTADRRAAAVPRAPRPTVHVQVREGAIHIRGAIAPSLAAVRDVRAIPCLVGAEGFECEGN